MVQLTHGQSAVFQGHVVFKGEALAQTFIIVNESKKPKLHMENCTDKCQNFLALKSAN